MRRVLAITVQVRTRLHWFMFIKCLIFICALGATMEAKSDPYRPADGTVVLEKLRTTTFDPVAHQSRELHDRLVADPTNMVLACEFARCCIERSRAEADPRFLGRAQSALSPWWDAAVPPMEVLVIRATIKQSQHEFKNALVDLDLATRLDPRNAQVWLTRATILTVLGDYAGARQACLPLAQLASGLISLTAVANVSSLNGGAGPACGLLRNALAANASASADEKNWALTALAEIEARLGHHAEAEAAFKAALALGQHDPYLLGAYADLLLEEGRAPEVAALLKKETRADALLLRLALAESAITPRPETFQAHLDSLGARYESGHLRGDFVHQREEARFDLELRHQPREALRLAQIDWQTQHEPADIGILLESALASGDFNAAQPALEFIRTNHLEDVKFTKLAAELGRR
jgi:tetratricopeptide (TPR) repeat protein